MLAMALRSSYGKLASYVPPAWTKGLLVTPRAGRIEVRGSCMWRGLAGRILLTTSPWFCFLAVHQADSDSPMAPSWSAKRFPSICEEG